jgi:hypothetical protein
VAVLSLHEQKLRGRCLNCHDLQVVDNDHCSGLQAQLEKKLPLGFSRSAEAKRIYFLLDLAKAALQALTSHDLKVVAI